MFGLIMPGVKITDKLYHLKSPEPAKPISVPLDFEYEVNNQHILQTRHVLQPQHVLQTQHVLQPQHVLQTRHVLQPQHVLQSQHILQPQHVLQTQQANLQQASHIINPPSPKRYYEVDEDDDEDEVDHEEVDDEEVDDDEDDEDEEEVDDEDEEDTAPLGQKHVTTISGNGQKGFKDGNARDALFNEPYAICCSNDGRIYVADANNHRIRMIYKDQVTRIAGNGYQGFQDGNALEAMFAYPSGICCSDDGRIYVSDAHNHRIRMIYKDQVTTIAGNGQKGVRDGNALKAMFAYPTGICCSEDGRIYICDYHNHRIRMLHNNQVTTVAGNGEIGFKDGNALEAMFDAPQGICCSKDGKIYVSDYGNCRIRMIENNQVTTIAGNGQRSVQDGNGQDCPLEGNVVLQATFLTPWAICCSKNGRIYFLITLIVE